MKIVSYIVISFFIAGALYSCKKDNFPAPSAQLTGALMYSGDTVYVEYNRVPFQLYQYGFGKVGAINGTFGQDGKMSTLLFNGDYKFIIPSGQGPFLWKQTGTGTPDSMLITMSGRQNIDIEVTPYYMIRNAHITAGSGSVSASFGVDKIITDANAKDIESVTLFINKSQFVSGSDNVARADMSGGDITDMNNINLSVTVPSLSQNFIYARVGVKIAGVEDMIFSQLVQISY